MIREITHQDAVDMAALIRQLSTSDVNIAGNMVNVIRVKILDIAALDQLRFYEKCGLTRGGKTAFIKRF